MEIEMLNVLSKCLKTKIHIILSSNYLSMDIMKTQILIDSFFISLTSGEPGDDQPFVANNEKVNNNLYLYSVSPQYYTFLMQEQLWFEFV